MYTQQTQKYLSIILYNIGPTSKTLGRRCTNVQMFCVCWAFLLVGLWGFPQVALLDLYVVFQRLTNIVFTFHARSKKLRWAEKIYEFERMIYYV